MILNTHILLNMPECISHHVVSILHLFPLVINGYTFKMIKQLEDVTKQHGR